MRAWIDELQHGFARRIKRMDMPEQEIISQGLGNKIEGVGNEVQVIEAPDRGLASQTHAVNLNGDSSRERPAANVVPGELTKRT